MFGLWNELFGFPVNSCDYEAIDCNKSYIPILNWDNDNEFVWSLWDPLEWWIDAKNVAFSTMDVQKRPASVTKVDQALEVLMDKIEDSKSTIKSFTFTLNQDWETLEWNIVYEDDSWTEYTKKASINLKDIIEWWQVLTLKDIIADSVEAEDWVFDTLTVKNWFTFDAPVVMNSTLQVDWAITWNAWVNITWWISSDTVTTSWDVTIWWDTTTTWNVDVWWNISITWTTTLNWETSINDDLTITDDLFVNGSSHLKTIETTGSVAIAWNLSVDWSIAGWSSLVVENQIESGSIITTNTVTDNLTVNWNIALWNDATAPDFVLQDEKGAANWVTPLDANWKVDPQYLPPVYTTAIVKMGTGVFSNSDTSVVVDADITADSFVAISNYSDIIWDLNEVINVWQLTVVSNQTETWSYKYIIVNPLP